MNEQAKGSTMYERFSAVAELNKAPGFDPLRFARRVVQNGGEKLLLDLKYKKLWFRLRYPQGRIKVTPLKITEQLAIIEAKVFFDRGDMVAAASFIAQRYAKDTPGGLYIESAQHMAVDTALNDAGFGVQLMSAGVEQPAQAVAAKKTAPVEMPVAAVTPPIAGKPIAPATQEERLTKEMPQATPVDAPSTAPVESLAVETIAIAQAETSVDENNAAALPIVEPSTEQAPVVQPAEAPPIVEEAVTEQPPVAEQTETAETVPMGASVAEESLSTPPVLEIAPAVEEAAEEHAPVAVDSATGEVRYTADTPVDTICALMTLDEARNIIVDVGTCKGQTLAWVSERRAASLKWYLNGYQGDNNMLRAGARLLLESLTMDKAS